MKKSLLALAVLGAFAGAASAQSSVTLYGRVDLSVGKNVGSDNKVMQNGSGSRLGLRGVEDLGGGLQALFNIEHRFDADTGAAQNLVVAGLTPTGAGAATINNNRFWSARSIVGLQGGFGQVVLGREYTTAFLGSQLIADPWGWDTIAASTGTAALTGLGIAKVRNDSSLTYKFSASGFSFGAQIAEATDTINNFDSRPINFSLGYAGGPIALHMGYERTGRATAAATEKMTGFGGSYNLGVAKLGAYVASGTTLANAKNKSWMLTGTAPIGAGELRLAFGRLTSDPAGVAPRVVTHQLVAVGYHYSLSKRTTLYADIARNSKLLPTTVSKGAYDVGIKHNF